MRLVMSIAAMLMLVGFQTSAAQEQSDPQATISALQTEVAQLQSPESTEAEPTETAIVVTPTVPSTVSEVEEPAGDESAKTVNVELILDVSGSMAQVLDTGETRMDAAKRVLS